MCSERVGSLWPYWQLCQVDILIGFVLSARVRDTAGQSEVIFPSLMNPSGCGMTIRGSEGMPCAMLTRGEAEFLDLGGTVPPNRGKSQLLLWWCVAVGLARDCRQRGNGPVSAAITRAPASACAARAQRLLDPVRRTLR